MNNPNYVTLYHGSLTSFDNVDIKNGLPYKDFGKGFYTSFVRSHAEKLAIRNKKRMKDRYKKDMFSYLYIYQMDFCVLSKLNVKKFDYADEEWMLFVLANRKSNTKSHNYDMVIGPTANDDIVNIIDTYFDGTFGEVGSSKALSTLIKLAESFNLPNQVYFGSAKATAFLELKDRIILN
jgi:hypothetical protein